MNLGELREEARGRLDDRAPPYLWTLPDLDRYINLAVEEAAIRARLIYDDRTPRIVEIPLRAGVKDYPLAAEVVAIDYARLQTAEEPLGRIRDRALREWDARWATRPGSPCAFYEGENSIRIYPTPDANVSDTILLALWRLPLCKLTEPGDEPEIPRREHPKLIDWVEREAYLKRDSDTYDSAKAQAAEDRFTASFGPRETADVYRKRRLRGATFVKARW